MSFIKKHKVEVFIAVFMIWTVGFAFGCVFTGSGINGNRMQKMSIERNVDGKVNDGNRFDGMHGRGGHRGMPYDGNMDRPDYPGDPGKEQEPDSNLNPNDGQSPDNKEDSTEKNGTDKPDQSTEKDNGSSQPDGSTKENPDNSNGQDNKTLPNNNSLGPII